jgi:hypothetical protein
MKAREWQLYDREMGAWQSNLESSWVERMICTVVSFPQTDLDGIDRRFPHIIEHFFWQGLLKHWKFASAVTPMLDLVAQAPYERRSFHSSLTCRTVGHSNDYFLLEDRKIVCRVALRHQRGAVDQFRISLLIHYACRFGLWPFLRGYSFLPLLLERTNSRRTSRNIELWWTLQ